MTCLSWRPKRGIAPNLHLLTSTCQIDNNVRITGTTLTSASCRCRQKCTYGVLTQPPCIAFPSPISIGFECLHLHLRVHCCPNYRQCRRQHSQLQMQIICKMLTYYRTFLQSLHAAGAANGLASRCLCNLGKLLTKLQWSAKVHATLQCKPLFIIHRLRVEIIPV